MCVCVCVCAAAGVVVYAGVLCHCERAAPRAHTGDRGQQSTLPPPPPSDALATPTPSSEGGRASPQTAPAVLVSTRSQQGRQTSDLEANSGAMAAAAAAAATPLSAIGSASPSADPPPITPASSPADFSLRVQHDQQNSPHTARTALTGGGRVLILSEEEHRAIVAAHAAAVSDSPGAPLPDASSCASPRLYPHGLHNPQCALVLLKTSSSLHSNYEQTAKLKFELVIHEKLFAADQAAEQKERETRPAQANTPHCSIFPRMRHLPDSRVALVLSDPYGTTLAQLMKTNAASFAALASPASAHTPMSLPSSGTNAAPQRSTSNASLPTPTAPAAPASLTVTSIESALRITLAITSKLSRMHAASLIHSALNPATLVINPTTGELQFLDLTGVSVLLKNRAEPDLNIHSHTLSSWMYLGQGEGHSGPRDEHSLRCRSILTFAVCSVCVQLPSNLARPIVLSTREAICMPQAASRISC